MKNALLLLQAAAFAAAAVVLPRSAEPQAAPAAGLPPKLTNLKSITNRADAKRVKIRVGPYTIPSTKTKNVQAVLLGTSGMVDDIRAVDKPCTECTILSMNADLEYANGTQATVASGSWLHHTVLSASGPGKSNAACNMLGGTDQFFSSGNERNRHDYANLNGTIDTGYHLRSADTLSLYSELMNMDPFDKTVYVTLFFDFLPLQANFKTTKAVWLQLHQCGTQDATAAQGNIDAMQRPKKQVFTETTAPWTSNLEGDIITVSGHVHDGGTDLVVYQNDKVICDAKATYGADMGGMQMEGAKAEVISKIGYCDNVGRVKKGDKFHIDAKYDFNLHPGMKRDDGSLDEIMGISIMLISVPQTAAETAGTTSNVQTGGAGGLLGGLSGLLGALGGAGRTNSKAIP